MAANRRQGKGTTPFKDRVTWRAGAKEKSHGSSPFNPERKYRSNTSAGAYGNTSPLLGNRAGFLPKRGAVEKERGGESSGGGGYRDRQVSVYRKQIVDLCRQFVKQVSV